MSQMEIEIEGSSSRLPRRDRRTERERPALPLRRLARLPTTRAFAAIASTTRSTTDRSVACIREISDSRRFNLIEALAAAIADALVERFDVSGVRVRVRKPEVQLDAPAAYSAATIERSRR